MNLATSPLLAQSLTQATVTLQQFAAQPNFLEQLRLAFGDNFDSNVALGIRSQFIAGDFSLIPNVRVLGNGELGTANGAYAGDLDEIFVSADFLAQHQGLALGGVEGDVAVVGLLLEEIGHKLDRLLNGNVDSPGDEGAIFRLLATGQTASAATLAGLQATDDSAVITVDGQSISVEQQHFSGDSGNNVLTGTSGDDTFYPGTGADTINGGGGNDYLQIINSTDTADTTIVYTIPTNGTVTGGSNSGTTFQNIERVYLQTGSGADNINISATTSGSNYVLAGGGDDTIVGSLTEDNNGYFGEDGDDNITGGNGHDTIYDGAGNDTVNGGAGQDDLYGGAGNDTLNGGDGDDYLFAGTGADSIDAGAGTDRLHIDNYNDTADTTIVYTTPTNGTVTGGSSDGTTFQNIERIYFRIGYGNDNINVAAITGNSSAYIIAGEGNDTIVGSLTGENNFYFGQGGDDNITGGNGIDYLSGESGNDTLNGGAGDDRLDGGTQNDTLNGGDGNDDLGDAAGNDRLDGGAGNDTLSGGDGIDTAIFSGNFTNYTISYNSNNSTHTIADTRQNSPDGTDTLTKVDFFQFADRVILNPNDDNNITAIEQLGAVKLALVNGNYAAIDRATSAFTPITYNGNPVSPTTFPGWSVIATERVGDTSTGEIEYLWQNTSNQFWYSTNINTGGFVSGNDLIAKEADFQQDFNGDGLIGAKTTIEQAGAFELAVANNQYVAIDRATSAFTPITYNGNPVSPTTFPGWSVIATERVGDSSTGEIEYLWKNTTGQFFYSTNTNTGSAVSPGPQLLTKEIDFQQDFDGDLVIGLVQIETAGTTTLAVNSSGQYIANNGGSDVALLYANSAYGPNTFPGWSVIGAEIVGAEVKAIWKNTNGQFWQSTNTDNGGIVAAADIVDYEFTFKQDFDNDSFIAQVSTAANDTFTGTAGKDAVIFKGNPLLSLQNSIGVDTINSLTVGGQDSIFLSKANFTTLTTAAGNPLAAADFGTVTTDLAAETLGNSIVYNSANGKLFYDANGAAAGFGAGGQFAQLAQLATGLSLTNADFKSIA